VPTGISRRWRAGPTIVGVNAFVATAHEPVETLYIDEAVGAGAAGSARRLRRDADARGFRPRSTP
jgi:methylmalonyl-CoA mutase N-terminal domain/subunit